MNPAHLVNNNERVDLRQATHDWQVIVLSYWASWAKPCAEALYKDIVMLDEKHHDGTWGRQQVDIVPCSIDEDPSQAARAGLKQGLCGDAYAPVWLTPEENEATFAVDGKADEDFVGDIGMMSSARAQC
eukprot:TRINITY_DN11177_c0_g1_i2.p2 TRINITY_DN11177_c0_g1~~TRINITY_DN11177_c0_g1_i2.p2  ORF type:complete len:129 (+),score=29.31 TRINITY_DN11177_c0_g1_i2:676-1062(+)